MWAVLESHEAKKGIDALQPQIAQKYDIWLAIVRQSGPQGLRSIKSFHDEKLAGKLAHKRSSRLSQQWRVVYSVDVLLSTVHVERLTPHDY